MVGGVRWRSSRPRWARCARRARVTPRDPPGAGCRRRRPRQARIAGVTPRSAPASSKHPGQPSRWLPLSRTGDPEQKSGEVGTGATRRRCSSKEHCPTRDPPPRVANAALSDHSATPPPLIRLITPDRGSSRHSTPSTRRWATISEKHPSPRSECLEGDARRRAPLMQSCRARPSTRSRAQARSRAAASSSSRRRAPAGRVRATDGVASAPMFRRCASRLPGSGSAEPGGRRCVRSLQAT